MRIGISGGTFDPVHKGHIESALAAKEKLKLDQVVFVPGGEPPHKLDRRITAGEDRLAMLHMALAPFEGLTVSEYELSKAGYSYSIDTVKHLAQAYGEEAELFYIIGADIVGELEHWKDCRELFELCRFAVFMRPGYDSAKFLRDVEYSRQLGAEIFPVEGPAVDISSERIRRAVRQGQTEAIAAFLPEGVRAYIGEKQLYVREPAFDEAFAVRNMKIRLAPERFRHSLQVAQEAMRIGTQFGIDPEKCRLAGLLHDCGKGVTEHQLHWLEPSLIELGKPEKGGNPAIVHGPAGAIIARRKYGIIDSEILEAIRCHVTGSPDMGPVAQAVFIADYTEPGRVGASFQKVRRILKEAEPRLRGLYGPVVSACDESIKYVLAKGEVLNPLVLETRNRFLMMKEETDEFQRNGR